MPEQMEVVKSHGSHTSKPTVPSGKMALPFMKAFKA